MTTLADIKWMTCTCKRHETQTESESISDFWRFFPVRAPTLWCRCCYMWMLPAQMQPAWAERQITGRLGVPVFSSRVSPQLRVLYRSSSSGLDWPKSMRAGSGLKLEPSGGKQEKQHGVSLTWPERSAESSGASPECS